MKSHCSLSRNTNNALGAIPSEPITEDENTAPSPKNDDGATVIGIREILGNFETPKYATYFDNVLPGSVPGIADIRIVFGESVSYELTWLDEFGDLSDQSVSGEAADLDEAKDAIEALVGVRLKHDPTLFERSQDDLIAEEEEEEEDKGDTDSPIESESQTESVAPHADHICHEC